MTCGEDMTCNQIERAIQILWKRLWKYFKIFLDGIYVLSNAEGCSERKQIPFLYCEKLQAL